MRASNGAVPQRAALPTDRFDGRGQGRGREATCGAIDRLEMKQVETAYAKTIILGRRTQDLRGVGWDWKQLRRRGCERPGHVAARASGQFPVEAYGICCDKSMTSIALSLDDRAEARYRHSMNRGAEAGNGRCGCHL
ncbi:MAG: hypothetical protein MZV49_01470 [Rhodopseudomonas palustris]|nr:hypothetical protein [Rhodopseudomonas palustris]